MFKSRILSGDLKNVLDYIYNGEVQIYQDNLDRFLDIAQRLKLDGLLAVEDKASPDYNDDKLANIMNKSSRSSIEYDVENMSKLEPDKVQMKTNITGTVAVSSDDMSSIDEKISELITRDEETKNYKCNLCGKCSKTKQNIQNHVEIHFDGLEFPCQLCDKICNTRLSLRMHNLRNHKSNV